MFSRAQILKRRAKLFRALAAHIDTEIVGDAIVNIADSLLDNLPPTVVRAAVYDSVRVLSGTVLTRKKAAALAWRLAGNVAKLNDGAAVLPWTGHVVDEVVPICVERVVPFKKHDKSGFIFHCRAQAGSLCGELFTQFLAANSLRVIARAVGFSSNSWGPLQYAGVARNFVNLLFFAHLDAAKSKNGPAFHHVSASSGMIAHNKSLIKVRCQALPCPEGFQHSCVNCFRGYDTCAFAVRAKTFVEADCKLCGARSFFDPEGDGLSCVNCSAGRKSAAVMQEETK